MMVGCDELDTYTGGRKTNNFSGFPKNGGGGRRRETQHLHMAPKGERSFTDSARKQHRVRAHGSILLALRPRHLRDASTLGG